MGVIYAAAGTAGFITTLLAKPLVDKIQANGNSTYSLLTWHADVYYVHQASIGSGKSYGIKQEINNERNTPAEGKNKETYGKCYHSNHESMSK